MLEDVLPSDLDVVFVGTAAGKRSSTVGQYYAGHGNRFWRTLHEVGLTDREYQPSQFRTVVALGMGFTGLCKTQAGTDHEINEWDVEGFERKIRKAPPRAVAFTSQRAAAVWLKIRKTRSLSLGIQLPRRDGFPTVFVLASTSGNARRYWTDQPWSELAHWLQRLRAHSR